MEQICFSIPGAPVGKARPRVTRSGQAYTPAGTVSYENLVKLCFKQKYPDWVPTSEQVQMKLVIEYPIPKSTPKKYINDMRSGAIRPMKKPDIDNIAKIVSDALNNIAYRDDSQIVELVCAKYYTQNEPLVEVLLFIGQ